MAAAGLSGCRLGNKITPVGVEVKGGEAVHFTLDVRPPAVLVRHALGKIDRHLGVDQAPVLAAPSPFGSVNRSLILLYQCSH